MNRKILFPLFTVGLFFYGCSKDTSVNNSSDDPIVASFQTSNLQVNQLAIYTSNGIISDASLVQGYLNRHFSDADITNRFAVKQTAVYNPGITIDFLKSSKIQLNGKLMEVTSINDTVMLASEYDSTDVPSVGNGSCDLLLAQVPDITPQTNCPSNTCTRYRKTWPIINSGGNYYLPTLYFAVSTVEASSGCSLVSPEYPMINILRDDLTTSLGAHDSVLVQIGRLSMIKKS